MKGRDITIGIGKMVRVAVCAIALMGVALGAGAVKLKMPYPEPALEPNEDLSAPQVWGYYNLTDEGKFYLQINYQFQDAFPFNRYVEMAKVKQGDKFGFISPSGVYMIPAIYDWAGEFSEEGFCVVQVDGKQGLIDTNGTVIIPIRYERLEDRYNGWYELWEDDMPIGYMNNHGIFAKDDAEYYRLRDME